MIRLLLALGVIVSFAIPVHAQGDAPKLLRVGMIGCDTSHTGVFAKAFNGPAAASDPDLAGFKLVAAFPGGSPDLPVSRDRLKMFVENLKKNYAASRSSIRSTSFLAKVDVVVLL